MRPGPLVDPDGVPEWLQQLVAVSGELTTEDFPHRRLLPRQDRPADPPRRAAVLLLFGTGARSCEPDLLLLRRSDRMTNHAGQVAFPGGAMDDGDDGVVDCALREAQEEVGVHPAGVCPVAVLPTLYVPPSNFLVTPVLGEWQQPAAVSAVNPAETAAVARVPISTLADPGNRINVRGPTGWTFPAFVVPGMLVWGFTGGLVHAVLQMGGWERPWQPAPEYDLATAWRLAEEAEVSR